MRSMTMKQVHGFIQRGMILNDERMPKSIYQSFREIDRNFGFVSKVAMFVDMDIDDVDEREVEVVDSVADVIAFLKRHGVSVDDME